MTDKELMYELCDYYLDNNSLYKITSDGVECDEYSKKVYKLRDKLKKGLKFYFNEKKKM